jgi:hypothetical protein
VQLDESAELDASVGTTKDVFEELLSHQLLLQMYGSISEVSLLIAGRSPVSWWPPDPLPSRGSASGSYGLGASTAPAPTSQPSAAAGGGAATSSGDGKAGQAGSAGLMAAAVQALAASTEGSKYAGAGTGRSLQLLVPLEEEVDLVAIKFQGAQVGVTVSGDGFSTEVAMAALTIDDLLVGARNPDKAHMARSSITWHQQQQHPDAAGSGQQQQQQKQQEPQPGSTAAAAAASAAGGSGKVQHQLTVDTSHDDEPIAFRTIADDDVGAEDEEFYDADEGRDRHYQNWHSAEPECTHCCIDAWLGHDDDHS